MATLRVPENWPIGGRVLCGFGCQENFKKEVYVTTFPLQEKRHLDALQET